MKLEASFDLSRDPSDYSKTRHYRKRTKDRTMVEDDVVSEAIEEGEPVKVDSNDEGAEGKAVTLRHDWLFSTFEVVVNPEAGHIKTAYEVEA
jgi:hypothetical protein